MDQLNALAVVAALFLSFAGWGRLTTRLANISTGWSINVAAGVAFLTLIGGVMNLAQAATPAAVLAIFILGLVLLVVPRVPCNLTLLPSIRNVAPLLPAILIACAYALAVPSPQFNPADDFQNYLVVIQRMLQTGSVGGNPLGNVGIDSLGMHAFFQGIVSGWLPPAYIGTLDPLLGLFLSLGLFTALASQLSLGGAPRALGSTALVIIQVQQINSSATYMATALVLALAVVLIARSSLTPSRYALAGAFVGALIGLKFTFAPFAILLGAGLVVSLCLGKRQRLALAFLGGTCVVLAPWVLNAALTHALFWGGLTDTPAPGVEFLSSNNLTGLLSSRSLFWGGYLIEHQAAFVAILGVSLFGCVGQLGSVGRFYAYFGIAHLAGLALWTEIAGVELAVRYVAPVTCALVAFGVCSFAAGIRVAVPRTLAATYMGIFCILCAPHAMKRIDRGAANRAIFAFDLEHVNPKLLRAVLSEPVREELRGLQRATEPGAAIFARIGLPFHLNFQRNPIYTLHATALSAPWVRIPVGEPNKFANWLKAAEIRYVLWQSYGPGVRPRHLMQLETQESTKAITGPARFNLSMTDTLSALVNETGPVLSHGPFVLIDLGRH